MQLILITTLSICMLGLQFPVCCRAADFFAAPYGKPSGTGIRADPWDLATALAQPKIVKPGDTLWLRGGVYRGGFTSRLRGLPGAPITVRQSPGERATIDCREEPNDGSTLFNVEGAWTIFRDFELTCTDPKRKTIISGSWPADINRGGFNCRGSHIKFINLVIHDTSEGFGFWSDGEGGEIYGCLIYYNGWKGPDRGHGHGIYTQNKTGIKRLVDNILFGQFGYGIHVYGSSKAFLKGFHIEGNVAFDNGSPVGPQDLTPGIFVGGESSAEGIEVVSNFTYGFVGGRAMFGYLWGPSNRDLVFKDNYIVGETSFRDWDRITCMGNTFINRGPLIDLDAAADEKLSSAAWDHNTYCSLSEGPPMNLSRANDSCPLTWSAWQSQTGLDKHSRLTPGPPNGVRVFVRANQYEPGRANIIIYNWDHRDTVSVDLRGVLKSGQQFRIVNAQDFYGIPALSGTYTGRPIYLPMTPSRVARPVGLPEYMPPITLPEFGVFVVLPMSEPPVASSVAQRHSFSRVLSK